MSLPGQTVYCCGHETFVPHAAAWPYECVNAGCHNRAWQGDPPAKVIHPETSVIAPGLSVRFPV